MKRTVASLLAGALALPATSASADPCGMVPPIWTGNMPNAITRVGAQRTYVFFEDGVETFVIRPEFSGKVDQFGMLIPFPSPPEMRKVPDDIFTQIAKAVDPPEINLWVGPNYPRSVSMAAVSESADMVKKQSAGLRFDQVKVLKQEAVGMYEVAVLEAGSASALKRWMTDHEYRFPEGMEDTTNDYVEAGWCFVAVKARVGQKAGVSPRPGMKSVDPQLPKGATFDGAVQGMGFRFQVDELVVPMRLSAFNAGRLRNVVYLLTEKPMKIRQLDGLMVKRQITGKEIHRNVNGPLPVRVSGGTIKDVTDDHLKSIRHQRDPRPHNGMARELFASDLRAAMTKKLSNPHEEKEKALLSIGEELNLRGKEIDKLNHEALKKERDQIFNGTLERLQRMTLTVIDGDFPRELLRAENLLFEKFDMDASTNKTQFYDARLLQAGQSRESSTFFWGTPRHLRTRTFWKFW